MKTIRKYSIVFIFLFIALSFLVSAEGEDIYVDLDVGMCSNVDVNDDEFEDIIICYNEDGTVTVDNIVFVDENMESVLDDDTTLLIPATYTEVKTYSSLFDEEEFRAEIFKEYMSYIYGLGAVLFICIIMIIILFSQKSKRSIKKTRKISKKRKQL